MRIIKKGLAFLLTFTLAFSILSTGFTYANDEDLSEDGTAVSSFAEPDAETETDTDTYTDEDALQPNADTAIDDFIYEEEFEAAKELDTELEEAALCSEISIDDWWNAMQDGDSYDIEVKMFKWPYADPPSFSMGNGALTGSAKLIKENGSVYVELYFQAIDMGSTIGHLTDFWYITDQDKAENAGTVNQAFDDLGISGDNRTVDNFINIFGEKCQYFYKSNNTEIDHVRFPIDDENETLVVGLESDFEAMGRQLCVLNFDFTNAIEAITGQVIERVKVVGTPTISSVLSADGSYFEVSIKIPKTAEAADADIYYIVSGSDDADLSNLITDANKYSGTFIYTKTDAAQFGGLFNVYAVGVKSGYNNSVINMKKIAFADMQLATAPPNIIATAEPTEHPVTSDTPIETETPAETDIPTETKAPDTTDSSGSGSDYYPDYDWSDDLSNGGYLDTSVDGKYRVEISLYNASIDALSMGNSAFENNSSALITVSGGTATIQIATNPVSIPPYYSALKEMQFQNANGQWQRVREVQTETITANDGTQELSLTYLAVFEFDLPSTSDEFIPVKINVPYTPMDSVVESDDGYIEARIRVDWSTLASTDYSDELVPDTEAAAGFTSYFGDDLSDSEAVDITDEDTGVRVTAEKFVFPSGTEFSFSVSTSGSEYESAKEIIGDTLEDFKLYIVNAQYAGDDIQPTGVAALYFPIDEEDAENIVIYRLTEETATAKAGKTEVEYEVSEDEEYYVISVKELGSFAIGKSDNSAATPSPTPTADPNATAKPDGTNSPFVDIEGHWAEEYINAAVNLGLFTGVDETHFAPDDSATRAMFITVLGRLSGVLPGSVGDNPFVDISEDEYYYTYVVWAYENGIVSGTSETEFSPDEDITREQIAAILYNFILSERISINNDTEYEFVDSEEFSEWSVEGINALAAAGILNGKEYGYFDPKGDAVRAEIATMLVRFISKYLTI